MYIDKNRAKMQEAAEKQKMKRKLLEEVRKKGYHFRTVFTTMPCWISTKCSAPAMDFFWHRTAIIPVRVEQIVKEFFNRRDKTPDLVRTSACTYQ